MCVPVCARVCLCVHMCTLVCLCVQIKSQPSIQQLPVGLSVNRVFRHHINYNYYSSPALSRHPASFPPNQKPAFSFSFLIHREKIGICKLALICCPHQDISIDPARFDAYIYIIYICFHQHKVAACGAFPLIAALSGHEGR